MDQQPDGLCLKVRLLLTFSSFCYTLIRQCPENNFSDGEELLVDPWYAEFTANLERNAQPANAGGSRSEQFKQASLGL
jgi:hypothetical protein